jgi:hypothetical protein
VVFGSSSATCVRTIFQVCGTCEKGHELRRDQLHVVPEGQQLTAEVIGADAGLHANQAGPPRIQPRLDLAMRELLAQDDGAPGIQADEMEAVLADADAKGQRAEAELWAWLRSSCWAPLMKGAPGSTAGSSH